MQNKLNVIIRQGKLRKLDVRFHTGVIEISDFSTLTEEAQALKQKRCMIDARKHHVTYSTADLTSCTIPEEQQLLLQKEEMLAGERW